MPAPTLQLGQLRAAKCQPHCHPRHSLAKTSSTATSQTGHRWHQEKASRWQREQRLTPGSGSRVRTDRHTTPPSLSTPRKTPSFSSARKTTGRDSTPLEQGQEGPQTEVNHSHPPPPQLSGGCGPKGNRIRSGRRKCSCQKWPEGEVRGGGGSS